MIQLLHQLREAGIRLHLQGDEIRFQGPKGAMTPELLRELRQHKAEIMDYLRVREGAGVSHKLDPMAILLPLQSGGAGTPLFFAHPAGGTAFCYRDLAKHLGPAQPFYGIRSPGWTEDPPRTIEEMASIYVRCVREVQPRGPYRLGAWSMGGPTVVEMARQLEGMGEHVDRLLLIDPAVPPFQDLHEFAVQVLKQLVMGFQHLLGLPMEKAQEFVNAGNLDAFFETALGALDGKSGPMATPELVFRCKRILLSHMEAFQSYTFEGRVHVGRTLALFTETLRIDQGLPWLREHIDGPLDLKLVERPHALLVFEPHVQLVSEHVRATLEG